MSTPTTHPTPQAQLQVPPFPPFPFPGLGPVLLAVLPNSGPVAGGNTVTLFGLGLAGTTSVLFGSTPATIVGQDPLGLTVTVLAPAHAAGAVQVTATNAAGTSNPVTYVYVAPAGPQATLIIPTSGPVAGGTPFAIIGSGLQNGSVTFGGTPATVLGTDPSGTVLFGTTPAGPVGGGNVPVVVTTPGGSATVPGGFTYLPVVPPPPIVTVPITPVSGTAGLTFTITGTNLSGATVLFGATPATGVTVNVGGTVITGLVPPGTPMTTVPVTVQTPGGSVSAGTFTYL
ncbi:cell surface receptor IPT/TIG domain-containing protein [Streptomyces sp. NRRL F-4489]|uniref:IPT/TIG domain-containing protein n=1 Tax=Streptomyces sp. NRRL F-4489 TaxID=1609095 RepID=UPI0007496DF3|nr:IPT/TIG domain-containing protein [Streptomyces sp. NRRL F-4489]KUL43817.1 cell surface receptor IPT/TIG domain-containing protein [Streptomyces sp. NRRL F-4489]